jgi:hypothetical protein
VISYPLTKVKGYIYLNIFCERSLGMVNTIPKKKPQEKFLRFFFGSSASPRLLYSNSASLRSQCFVW